MFQKLPEKKLITSKSRINKKSISGAIDFYKMVDINADNKTIEHIDGSGVNQDTIGAKGRGTDEV